MKRTELIHQALSLFFPKSTSFVIPSPHKFILLPHHHFHTLSMVNRKMLKLYKIPLVFSCTILIDIPIILLYNFIK